MMKYRAVFFDRDGTLTAYDPEKEAWRDRMISSWSGHLFVWTYDRMMSLFRQAGEGRTPWYRDVPEEQALFRRFYRLLLREEGGTEDCGRRADELFDGLWCRDRILYPETVEVLEYFRARGFRMGVISDTLPLPGIQPAVRRLGVILYLLHRQFSGRGRKAGSPHLSGRPESSGGDGGGKPVCGRLRRGSGRRPGAGIYRFSSLPAGSGTAR